MARKTNLDKYIEEVRSLISDLDRKLLLESADYRKCVLGEQELGALWDQGKSNSRKFNAIDKMILDIEDRLREENKDYKEFVRLGHKLNWLLGKPLQEGYCDPEEQEVFMKSIMA